MELFSEQDLGKVTFIKALLANNIATSQLFESLMDRVLLFEVLHRIFSLLGQPVGRSDLSIPFLVLAHVSAIVANRGKALRQSVDLLCSDDVGIASRIEFTFAFLLGLPGFVVEFLLYLFGFCNVDETFSSRVDHLGAHVSAIPKVHLRGSEERFYIEVDQAPVL